MKKGLSILMILVLCFVLLVGCGGGGVVDNGGSSDGGGEAAPAEQIVWKVQGYTAAGTFFDTVGKHLADTITEASGGRLTIDWNAADSIVAVGEGANAVRDGILDAVWDYSGMYNSLNDAFPLFCSSPGLFSDPMDMYTWMVNGGGEELWQECWDAYDMNNHVIFAGCHEMEDWMWSNQPIETIDDMKGITLRMMPIMGTILADNGLSVAFVSGTEIVSSMERGVIDAGEYSIPALDKTFGFQDVAKYYARPGIHQPTGTQELLINKDKWEALPDDLKKLVEICCHDNVLYFISYGQDQNIEAMKFFEEEGITLTQLTEETQKTLLEWIDKWYEDNCPGNELLTKVHESQVAHIKRIAAYKDSMHIPYPDWAYED